MLEYLFINNFIVKKITLGLVIFILSLTKTKIETQSSHLILQSYLMKWISTQSKQNQPLLSRPLPM